MDISIDVAPCEAGNDLESLLDSDNKIKVCILDSDTLCLDIENNVNSFLSVKISRDQYFFLRDMTDKMIELYDKSI
jgi:hypothetical protein